MRRRELLGALLLGFSGASPSIAGEPGPRAPGPAPDGTELRASPTDSLPLVDVERETLLAFAGVLLGERPLSAAARRELLSHIVDRVSASDGMLALYRQTAALLDRLAGAPFSTFEIDKRLALVVRHRLVPSRGRVEPRDDAARAVRTRVAPDLIAGYYASPIGWALVGYVVFPGRCGDLVRYTRPEP